MRDKDICLLNVTQTYIFLFTNKHYRERGRKESIVCVHGFPPTLPKM